MRPLVLWLAGRFSGSSSKKAPLYLLCLAVPFTLENAVDILEIHSSPKNNLLMPVFVYQWIVTVGPRKPRAHFVRIAMIDRKTEPDEITSETSPCVQRDFMAKLLTTISSASPAVIAIDKFYPQDNCTPAQSQLLLSAVADISHRLPVVLLRLDSSEVDLQGRSRDKLEVVHNKKAVVSFPTLDFGSAVHYGLKTLNADERRIPLEWPVYASPDFDTKPVADLLRTGPQREETLSVATVRQYDPGTLSQQTIKSFVRSSVHPFTSFLRASEIPTDSAIDLVCGQDRARDLDWRRCTPPAPSSGRLKELRNRVVVIGQNHSADIHRTVIGSVPGVVLQANYIESLLDDRYLKPAPLWVQLLISIAWLGIVEHFFSRWEARPNHALLLSATVITILWLLTYDIAVLQLGRYLVLWPPSAAAMLGRYVLLKLSPKAFK